MGNALLTKNRKYVSNYVGYELCADESKLWLNIHTSNRSICGIELHHFVGQGAYFTYKGLKLVSITNLLEKALP
ncbi:MAG: hypothetical protein ACRCX2_17735 [Paraclostridium sp.]